MLSAAIVVVALASLGLAVCLYLNSQFGPTARALGAFGTLVLASVTVWTIRQNSQTLSENRKQTALQEERLDDLKEELHESKKQSERHIVVGVLREILNPVSQQLAENIARLNTLPNGNGNIGYDVTADPSDPNTKLHRLNSWTDTDDVLIRWLRARHPRLLKSMEEYPDKIEQFEDDMSDIADEVSDLYQVKLTGRNMLTEMIDETGEEQYVPDDVDMEDWLSQKAINYKGWSATINDSPDSLQGSWGGYDHRPSETLAGGGGTWPNRLLSNEDVDPLIEDFEQSRFTLQTESDGLFRSLYWCMGTLREEYRILESEVADDGQDHPE
jgi:Asp-tRNA(Asn)/Glu-tRNA(Gln) amidotransferase C subunit